MVHMCVHVCMQACRWIRRVHVALVLEQYMKCIYFMECIYDGRRHIVCRMTVAAVFVSVQVDPCMIS